MQWRAIPGFPAYEINKRGRIRKAGTHYNIQASGRCARLSAGGAIVRRPVVDLIAKAFALNPRPSVPPRTSRRPEPMAEAKTPETVKKQRKRKTRKRLPKPMPFNPKAFYHPKNSKGHTHRMNMSFCPWNTAQIEGTAMGADPILGF